MKSNMICTVGRDSICLSLLHNATVTQRKSWNAVCTSDGHRGDLRATNLDHPPLLFSCFVALVVSWYNVFYLHGPVFPSAAMTVAILILGYDFYHSGPDDGKPRWLSRTYLQHDAGWHRREFVNGRSYGLQSSCNILKGQHIYYIRKKRQH